MQPLHSAEAVTAEAVRFRAGRYRLEGELAYPDSTPAAAIVIAGPHSLLGGTMHNNIVRALGDGLAARGFVTLRFNYAGVGASEGPVADAPTNLAAFWQTSHALDDAERADDLVAAVAYLRSVAGAGVPMRLIGYSFGCTLLPGALPLDEDAIPLALVAPTIGRHDYTPYETLANPKLVIAPHEDFAADVQLLDGWFDRLAAPKQLIRPRLDGHFFRGHEDWLVAAVGRFLDESWSPGS
jgi:alpha/beta superfamily hydrolase